MPHKHQTHQESPLSFKFALLGLLANGPRHGYELKAAYETDLLPSVKLNYGQVYTTLERLSREGMVECEKVNQTERPDKKVYALTEMGRDQLQDWLLTPSAQEVDLRDSTMLKLLLSRQISEERPKQKGKNAVAPAEILASERRACMDRLHEYTLARAEAVKRGGTVETRLVLDYAMLRLESFLNWFQRCEDELTRLENES